MSLKVDYRPDIDGLRAIAVISVVLFHAKYPLFKGGFVGVDVFFVISGYLITRLTLSQETVDFAFLKTFYERRIRRLLPPIIPVLLVTSALTYSQLNPDATREYIKSLLAFLFLSSNWYFLSISGYFDGASDLKPLLHTWSLSVEEQFYILFPLSTLLIKRFYESSLPRFILFVLATSLALNIYLVSINDLNGAVYNSVGRFWEIAVGSLIASGFVRSPTTPQTKDVLGIVGLAMIAISMVFGSPADATAWTMVATIGTASVILAQDGKANRQLAAKPLIGIGLISYALYLWHWPLFAFLNVANANGVRHALAILIALALSVVSYVAIERPLRFKALLKRRQVFAAFACSIILFFSSGLAGIATNGFQTRFPNRERDYEILLRKEVRRQAAGAMRAQCWTDGVSDDFGAMIAQCISPRQGRPRILLVGDSHAAQLVYGFKQSLPGIDVDLLAVDTCSLTGMFLDPNRPTCLAIIRFIDNLKEGDFDAIFLTTQVVLSKKPVAAQKFLARIQHLAKITTVYVLGPIQYYRPNMPTIYMGSVGRVADVEIGKLFDAAVQDDPFEYDQMLKRSLAEIPGANYISLLDILCPGKQCRHFDATGWPILIDDSHISVAVSHDLVARLAQGLEISQISHSRSPLRTSLAAGLADKNGLNVRSPEIIRPSIDSQ